MVDKCFAAAAAAAAAACTDPPEPPDPSTTADMLWIQDDMPWLLLWRLWPSPPSAMLDPEVLRTSPGAPSRRLVRDPELRL